MSKGLAKSLAPLGLEARLTALRGGRAPRRRATRQPTDGL